MNKKLLATAITIAFLTTIAGASAVTWNLTDSVTGTEGSVNNGASISGGVLLVDGTNDYFNTQIAVNYTGAFSFSAWFKKNTSVNCQDGGAIIGREYQWRIETGSACEIIANVQNITGSDKTHYNASLVFTNNTWRHVVWTWEPTNNRSVVYVDNILRSNITQQGIKQVSSTFKWMAGGDPFTNLYVNGSIANITVWNTTLSQAQVTTLYNNNTPTCTNLENWWAFASTNVSCTGTPAFALYVNITIGNTTIRVLPEDYRGYHTAEWIGTPIKFSNGTSVNNTMQQQAWNSTGAKDARWDMDFGNICQTYSGNTSAPCVWSTSTSDNYANINIHKASIALVAANGGKVFLVNDGPSRWMASNLSNCNYGANAPDFDYVSCDFYNNTLAANAMYQYAVEIGCTTTYAGMCYIEGRNEPYNINGGSGLGAGVGSYYYRNSTQTCYDRITGQIAEWVGIYPRLKTLLTGTNTTIISPALNYGYSACGVVMSGSFMGNYTYGAANSPNMMNIHEYSQGGSTGLITNYATAQAAVTAGGYGAYWVITETELNNDAVITATPWIHNAQLMETTMYTITNTSLQALLYYIWYGGEEYRGWNGTLINTVNSVFRSGLVMNATKYIDTTSGLVKPCTVTGATGVTCAFVLKNSTEGVLLFSNNNNNNLSIQTITYTGNNITAARSNTNGTSLTVSGGSAYNISNAIYSFDGYNITLSSSAISNISYSGTNPATTLSIVEPNNQTFSVNVTNTDNITLTYEWLVNGSNQTISYNSQNFTLIGNYSSAGTYNITNKVYSSQNTINYTWILTVNNTLVNISYSTTSPATPITIAEPDSQAFSVIVNNPTNITATYEWLINGTNQTGAYNSTSVTFTGSYTAAGLYNITNKVYTNQNNLNYSWALTVTETNETTGIDADTACYQATLGMTAFASYFNLFAIAIIGIFIAFAVWKWQSGDFTFDASFFIQMTMAIILAGILLAIGAILVSGAAANC